MMQPAILPGEDLEQRSPTFIHLMGPLKPGVTVAQAQADLSTIARRIAREYPASSRNVGIFVAPVWKAHYGAQSLLLSALLFLSVVAVLVLLIACANIANLLLARAPAIACRKSAPRLSGRHRWNSCRFVGCGFARFLFSGRCLPHRAFTWR